MNRKHSKTKTVEKISLVSNGIKNGISIFEILIGKKYMREVRKIIIKSNLLNGLTLILRSSMKPIKNRIGY